MKKNGSFPVLVFVVVLGIGAALAYAMHRVSADFKGLWILGGAIVLASVASSAIQVADQWSKAVVLRLGKFRSLQGPGLFLIIPLIDTIPYWLDIRVLTSSFKAEKTLTKDTVPVDVDAVLFWKIVDPKKAALDVADYQSAINWAPKRLCVMSSARRCFRICSKAGTKLVTRCRRSSTSAPNRGASTSFLSRLRMC